MGNTLHVPGLPSSAPLEMRPNREQSLTAQKRLLQSSPKFKVWWRVSAAWAGNTLALGELGRCAGKEKWRRKFKCHRGRKWDLATEWCFL